MFLALPIVVVMVVSFSSATYLDVSHRRPSGCAGTASISPATIGRARPGSASGSQPSVVVLATLLGTLAALGIARLPKALRVSGLALILSPLIVPVIVVAIGIYYAFARYGLVGTPAGLIFAHTCLAVLFVVTSVKRQPRGHRPPRWSRRRLSLGATPTGTFFPDHAATDPPRRSGRRPVRLHHIVR